MKFDVFDVERPPKEDQLGGFHVVIAATAFMPPGVSKIH